MRLLVPVDAPPLHIFSPDEAAGAKGTTMALSANYKAFLEDLFAEFGPVEVRSMFGGAGIFADGVMLGLAADGVLYLKADEIFAGEFAAEGKAPFTYQAKGRKPVSMSYWEVPERLLDDPAEFAAWARRAHSVALAGTRSKSAQRPRTGRRPPKAS